MAAVDTLLKGYIYVLNSVRQSLYVKPIPNNVTFICFYYYCEKVLNVVNVLNFYVNYIHILTLYIHILYI